MRYSTLTYILLARAVQTRDNLKEAEKKSQLYNLYRSEDDLERKVYERLDVPVRKFLYGLSAFNFDNFRRLDKFLYRLKNPERNSRNSNLAEGAWIAALGTCAVTMGILVLDDILRNFNSYTLMQKTDAITLEAIFLGGGLSFILYGARKIKKATLPSHFPRKA